MHVKLFGQYRVVLLGLDNAGKTTFASRSLLLERRIVIHPPTLGLAKHGWARLRLPQAAGQPLSAPLLNLLDLGGANEDMIQGCVDAADAVIFVVDAADRERFGRAADMLKGIVHAACSGGSSHCLPLRRVPVLVLGSKSDLATAASACELRAALRLPSLRAVSWEQERLVHIGGSDAASPLSRLPSDALGLIASRVRAAKATRDAGGEGLLPGGAVVSDPFHYSACYSGAAEATATGAAMLWLVQQLEYTRMHAQGPPSKKLHYEVALRASAARRRGVHWRGDEVAAAWSLDLSLGDLFGRLLGPWEIPGLEQALYVGGDSTTFGSQANQ